MEAIPTPDFAVPYAAPRSARLPRRKKLITDIHQQRENNLNEIETY